MLLHALLYYLVWSLQNHVTYAYVYCWRCVLEQDYFLLLTGMCSSMDMLPFCKPSSHYTNFPWNCTWTYLQWTSKIEHPSTLLPYGKIVHYQLWLSSIVLTQVDLNLCSSPNYPRSLLGRHLTVRSSSIIHNVFWSWRNHFPIMWTISSVITLHKIN